MSSIKFDIKPSLVTASKEFTNKVEIEFPLLRTLPTVNANGDTYDYEKTKDNYETVVDGYINLEHQGWLSVGTITEAWFEDIDGSGVVMCKGVLWKSVLEEFDISVADIKEGKFAISMEVFYSQFYVMHGDERIELPEAEEYAEYKGQSYKGKEVKKVIIPTEYSGAALTENPADKTLDIQKVVASKIENKVNKKEEVEDMYKQFETENDFNKFVEDLKEDIKKDEDVLEQARAGYVEVDNILGEFEEIGFEDIEDLDTAIAKVNKVLEDFAEYKQEVARDKKLSDRKATLRENNIDIEKLDASDEDLLEMTEKSFELVVKANKEAMKAEASVDKKDKFDPTNVNIEKDEEIEVKDIINAL